MSLWKTLAFICAVSIYTEAKYHQKRAISNICDPVFNNTNKVQCYCTKEPHDTEIIRTADCFLASNDVTIEDKSWESFDILKSVNKLTFDNTRKVALDFIPTNALKHTYAVLKLDIKHADIEKITPYAFANLTLLEEITLRDNGIEILENYAFAHHRDLTTLSLDKNNIIEINRDVFVDLPSLEKLFLTSNKITTIHDRAFVHLSNLRELEIDRNSLFSLNSETFSGLKKLQKLDLSSNSLEVIGDNTFLPLANLRSLNLEGNKIQMMDDMAFNGLSKLQSLSLAHNKISEINNVKVFEGLETLTSLGLRGNQIRELKTEVMAPILNNFYGIHSALDVEDNNFPCDCRLDWFMSLMNKTQNSHLRISIENLKCYPDPKLRELWLKNEDSEKNTGQVFENEETQVDNTDYEYYDETQLNGKLFYYDVRDLLNCSSTKRVFPQIRTASTTVNPKIAIQTKAPSISQPTSEAYAASKVLNQGLLDLSLDDTTKAMKERTNQNIENQNTFTTTRLATVSAKPQDKDFGDRDMASDEAKPDTLKAHRSIQGEIKDEPSFVMNSANNIYVTPIVLLVCSRLFT